MFEFTVVDGHTIVTGYDDGSDWIYPGAGYQGIGGHRRDQLWQLLPQGELRIRDLPARTIGASLNLQLNNTDKLRAVSGCNGTRLYVLSAEDVVAIDLERFEVTGRTGGLPIRFDDRTAVMDDGSLLVSAWARAEDKLVEKMLRVDGHDLSFAECSIPCARIPDAHVALHWLHHSPNGRWWLRFDHLNFPVVEHSPAPGEPARRYFGATFQLWSAFPLKFERRVVVAWLKAENLPDETHIYQPWNKTAAQGTTVAAASQPSSGGNPFRRKVFGRAGLNSPPSPPAPADPRQAAMLASVPERDRIYLAISEGLHRPDLAPDAPFPQRADFGAAATDDRLWSAITRNLEKLVRDSLRRSIGWQEDGEALWLDRVAFLICLGMDGGVSPQIWCERFGQKTGMMVPFANLPQKLEVLSGRRALAIETPFEGMFIPGTAQLPARTGGSMLIDGAAVQDRYEPYMIPTAVDGWQAGVDGVPPTVLRQEGYRKRIQQLKLEKSKVRIPLDGDDDVSRSKAIERLAASIDASFLQLADDHEIDIGFVHGGTITPEQQFFESISDEDASWAIPALRHVVSRYVQAERTNRDTFYQPNGASVLAQAVRRLGELDPGSLPLIVEYGQQIDGGHEYYFAGDTVPSLIRTHGWSEEMVSFVSWVLLYNFYNTYDQLRTVWRDLGLGDALARTAPGPAAARMASEFAPFVARGQLNWSSIPTLRGELGNEANEWELAFFAELGRLIPETAVEA